jgi:hypothetical protein
MMKTRLAPAVIVLGTSVLSIAAQQGGPGAPLPNPAANPPRLPLEQRIAHNDPSRYRSSSSVHGGPGRLNFFAMFGGDALDTNLWFLHRGVLEPKSGIGAHFHNYCEEMFVILDGEAQFTIDGRTSTLKAPAGAPARMGHSHAIYNATDTPVQWMNINVTAFRGVYDAFDLGDGRVGARRWIQSPSSCPCSSTRRGSSRWRVSKAGRVRRSTAARSRRPCSSRHGRTSITFCCRPAPRSGLTRSRASAASLT